MPNNNEETTPIDLTVAGYELIGERLGALTEALKEVEDLDERAKVERELNVKRLGELERSAELTSPESIRAHRVYSAAVAAMNALVLGGRATYDEAVSDACD